MVTACKKKILEPQWRVYKLKVHITSVGPKKPGSPGYILQSTKKEVHFLVFIIRMLPAQCRFLPAARAPP